MTEQADQTRTNWRTRWCDEECDAERRHVDNMHSITDCHDAGEHDVIPSTFCPTCAGVPGTADARGDMIR